jgi:hypothetical protein
MLLLWVPGDDAVALPESAFTIPVNAKLLVRVRYVKTWQYERQEMSDRTRVGLYFADESAPPLRRIALVPGSPVTLPRASRALAIYPDSGLADRSVVVTAIRPGGQRDDLIAFHPRHGWARRYWFRDAVSLPRGTRLTVRITPESPALLPPGLTPAPPAAGRRQPAANRVFLNIM